ncbi:MAG TPA: FMN-binding protein [Microbacterium sp.]|uniref:FMN-binding protein n=1 Tax=Microbacterium sp. TaxID=51671 RepID=UPI002C4A925F|nr:FMN-binding protein [Microbacterium sp.]HWI32365.1 FMN-binding protein [Microbacterium sp.]
MIRTNTLLPHPLRPNPLRAGAALAGVAGVLLLAGCGASPSTAGADDGTDTGASDTGSAATGSYTDGTYTAEGSYQTPESIETIDVTVTLADGVITDVGVVGHPTKPETEEYQGKFIGGISDEVVGKSIDEINVSRVAGSSLTSGGFNKAIEEIKSEAAA